MMGRKMRTQMRDCDLKRRERQTAAMLKGEGEIVTVTNRMERN
jgi:hypothetical protein